MLSETTGPTEAKFHVASPWYRGKDGNLIQMIRSFVFIHHSQPPVAGTFSRDFTINLAPQCRAFASKN